MRLHEQLADSLRMSVQLHHLRSEFVECHDLFMSNTLQQTLPNALEVVT